MITKIAILSISIFLFNIPFGYWRANVKKFSIQWVLAIHLPVPFIVFLRIYSEIGFAWFTYVFFVAAFFLGQRVGAIFNKKTKLTKGKASSCLVMDLCRNYCVN